MNSNVSDNPEDVLEVTSDGRIYVEASKGAISDADMYAELDRLAKRLTLEELQQACRKRNVAWTGDTWSTDDCVTELMEEFGEFCGALKRVKRYLKGAATDGMTYEQATAKMLHELGDIQVCVANLANSLQADLGECTRTKFNMTSDKYGFTEHKI